MTEEEADAIIAKMSNEQVAAFANVIRELVLAVRDLQKEREAWEAIASREKP